jgi:signal transduction histidine kinase
MPAELPPLESDEIRVTRILQNLMANAIKFTDQGGVTVSAESDGQTLSVRVADTGIGMAREDLPHIFEEFRQVNGSASRRHEGTGLGLAIARKSARILGGDITVESTPGQGSVFTLTLTLPLAWPGDSPDPAGGGQSLMNWARN